MDSETKKGVALAKTLLKNNKMTPEKLVWHLMRQGYSRHKAGNIAMIVLYQ